MVSAPDRQSALLQKSRILHDFCPELQNCDDFDLCGDILASHDFIFARKRHKTAVASALNSNNNKETQR